jgi:hypothetical protein
MGRLLPRGRTDLRGRGRSPRGPLGPRRRFAERTLLRRPHRAARPDRRQPARPLRVRGRVVAGDARTHAADQDRRGRGALAWRVHRPSSRGSLQLRRRTPAGRAAWTPDAGGGRSESRQHGCADRSRRVPGRGDLPRGRRRRRARLRQLQRPRPDRALRRSRGLRPCGRGRVGDGRAGHGAAGRRGVPQSPHAARRGRACGGPRTGRDRAAAGPGVVECDRSTA